MICYRFDPKTGHASPATADEAWQCESRVAETALGRGQERSRISTVFLQVNHAFGDGPPILFETMVFGGPLDGLQDRYATVQEAWQGHDAMAEQVREALKGNA